MNYEISDVLEFLSDDFKDRREIEIEFGLNNMQSWKLVKWLSKAGLVEVLKARIEGKKCKVTYMYRKKV